MWWDRRIIGVLGAGLLALLLSTSGCATLRPSGDAAVRVRLDPSRASAWTVDRRIFGKFHEHNGKDAYPGIYAQHLANASFEDWYTSERGHRTAVLYPETEVHPGIAYPWEPIEGQGRVSWMREAGGQNGDFQRIVLSGERARGGVRQRVVIPDRRTRTYRAGIFVRGSVDTLGVRLEGADGRVSAQARIAVGPAWERRDVHLVLPSAGAPRFQGADPFGAYTLHFVAEGPGHVDLDHVLLVSGDAVAGKFNPTTIELLRTYNVTGLRWPGGNWASAYHWEDGVGPLLERPVRRNLAWGGLEPNYLGTNEFLAFCRLVGVEPLINVGFNQDISPEEAARWVAYVNGDTTTAMGWLRAKHGYPEPWDVELWQVGNETYGSYQIGHVDAETFARRFQAYYDAMKAADSSITVIASGVDPAYVHWGGNAWNETLFEIAGTKVEGIDIHRYVKGIRRDERREAWDPVDYHQVMVAFPAKFEELLERLRASAAARGIPDLQINVGEWNMGPDVSEGWPNARYPTMAHASFVAGMYNAFIRQGEAVRYSYQRDNTLYFRPYHYDMRPVNPGNYTLRFYSEPFEGGGTYHHLPLQVEGPTFDMRSPRLRHPAMEDVPYVDAAALRSAAGKEVIVYVTNRDLRRAHTVAFALAPAWRLDGPARALLQWSEDPFAEQTSWAGPESFELDERTITPEPDGVLRIRMPAASVLRLRVEVAHRL